MNELRQCKICGQQKEADANFHSFISGGKWKCYSSYCKECIKERARNRYRNDSVFREKDKQRCRNAIAKVCRSCGVKRDTGVKWATESTHKHNKGKKSLCLSCFESQKEASRLTRKARKRRYGQKHKSEIRVKNNTRRRNNVERNREYQRNWAAEYRAKNPDVARAKAREWKRKNKEKAYSQFKKWASKYPDKILSKNRLRRALKRNAVCDESLPITNEWFRDLCAQHSNKCYYCWDGERKLTMDHVKPLSRGGTNTRDNILPSCKSCNSRKRSANVSEWRPWLDVPIYGLELASA